MPSRRTVVVVDDDLQVRHLVSRMLQRHGFTVELAADGCAGLACFTHLVGEGRRPVALVTDADMPTMDGQAMVAALADGGHLMHVALVLMSGAAERWAATVERYGGRVLSKPFTAAELLSAVTEHLS